VKTLSFNEDQFSEFKSPETTAHEGVEAEAEEEKEGRRRRRGNFHQHHQAAARATEAAIRSRSQQRCAQTD